METSVGGKSLRSTMSWGFYIIQQGLKWFVGGGLLFLAPFALLTSWGRRQWLFEWKNASLVRPEGKAWVAFEVASEGELEQIRPLAEYFVEQIKKFNQQGGPPRYLELVFASPSVEKKALAFGAKYPQEVFVARLPLLTWGPKIGGRQPLAAALQAPNVFFCRYDFYPHLLVWAAQKKHRAFLLSATLKNKLKGRGTIWYYQQLMQTFYHIVSATDESARWAQIKVTPEKVSVYDFRHRQIGQRLKNASATLAARPGLAPFLEYLQAWPREKRVIIGSAWPPELAVLKDPAWQTELQQGRWQLTIAPHQLKAAAVNNLRDIAEKELGFAPIVISPELGPDEVRQRLATRPSVVLLTVPGILCEIYAFFTHAMVGGGYGRSIHSLLEPYWANCIVYGGPKVFRSTEYDYVVQNSSQWVHLLAKAADFYPCYLARDMDDVAWMAEQQIRQQRAYAHQENFLLLAHNLLQSLRPLSV